MKPSKGKIIALVLSAVFVAAFILVSIKVAMDQPQDLGPELEYVGKRHTGCPLPLPLGYILLCSSGSGEEYYFATDLKLEGVQEHFERATLLNNRPRLYPAVERELEKNDLSFKANTGEVFVISLYNNSEGIRRFASLRSTTKKNIVGISAEDYKLAQKAHKE